MIAYKFREQDNAYEGTVTLPDMPFLPPYHTATPPPEQQGFYAVMANGWHLVPGTPPDLNYYLNKQLAYDARQARDQYLQECDWTQVPDSTVDKTAWAEYRQALRDITAQAGFPTSIQWPARPQ
jgi:hypothetical protein